MSSPPVTVLGFDFGLRRIGVAIGQTVTGSARALTTISARDGKPDWDEISALIREWQPGELVVGLPLHLDDGEHARTHAARRFGNRLSGRFHLPVHLVDERLSSDDAERQLRERGLAPNQHNKERVDALAAQLILQTWLDCNTAVNDTGTGK